MRRAAAVLAFATLGACHATRGGPSAPASDPPTMLAMALQPDRDRCTDDQGCQVLAACECDRCIASRRMDVQMCPSTCARDACAGQHARCDHHLCRVGETKRALTPEALAAATAAGQAFFDAKGAEIFASGSLPLAWEPGVTKPAWTWRGAPIVLADGLPDGACLVPTGVEITAEHADINLWREPTGPGYYAELEREPGTNRWVVLSR